MRGTLTALAALAAAGCSVIGAGEKAAEPPHAVVERLDDATEIRRYGPRVMAVTSDADGESAAFGRLFRYISGANDGGREIAMTAPVAVGGTEIAMTAPVAAGGGEMRFFLPAGFSEATTPTPTDPQVRIATLPEQTVAARRWSGLRTEAAARREADALRGVVEASAWRAVGPVEGWYYDPPWTLPPFRRNEAAVPVAPR